MLDLQHKVKSELVCYSSDQIPSVWNQVKDFVQQALDQGSNYVLDDIEEGLLSKRMQLWCWQDTEIRGALVTTLLNKDGMRFCLFLSLGGSRMNEWIDNLSIVEQWAKDQGCEEMRVYGRIGWARVIGYDVEYTKMVKRI